MINKGSSLKFLIFLLFSSLISAQIKLVHLPPQGIPTQSLVNNTFLSKSSAMFLNSGWRLYKPDEPENKVKVDLPFIFNKSGKFVLEKTFEISPSLKNRQFKLVIYGLNYSADVTWNDITIGRNLGGGLPIELNISSTLLNFKNPNLLKILLRNELDSKNTLPANQRFLMPKHYGGINGNVFLEVLPSVYLGEFRLQTKSDGEKKSFECSLNIPLIFETAKDENQIDLANFKVEINLIDPASNQVVFRKELEKLQPDNVLKFVVKNAKFWSPQNPFAYNLQARLFNGSELLDERQTSLPVYYLSVSPKGILLNGKKFVFRGTTYSPLDPQVRQKQFAVQAEEDLTLIKNSGFNFIKFKGFYPQPFLLKLCEKIGLIPAVELPLQTPPRAFLEDDNFVNRIKLITLRAAKYYSRFPVVKLFGLGSFNGSLAGEGDFISKIAGGVKSVNLKTFASFIHLPEEQISNLDFYGLEVFASPVKEALNSLKNSSVGVRGFIGEISYPNDYGKTSGYLNAFSNEAQAKYFSDLITLTNRMGTNGFIINSVFNYRGDFCSLYGKYDEHNVYHLGLTNEQRRENSFSLNIIRRLLREDKITPIPIGSNKNASPMFFIIVSLILGVLMGLLFNSKRKFREDAARSLSRPYNFFADIRDRRILIGFQTVVLTLLLAAIHGLLLTIIFFYLKTNILFEKILLAFNSPALIKFISYLSWNPVESFVILSLLTLVLFLVLMVVIKIASGFVKQLVLFSNIFNVVVWSFLPLTILLPFELILHKLLLLGFLNIYIYAVLLIFFIWVIKRILRGVYVIFDVNPFSVYLGGFLFLVLILGLVLIYYQSEYYSYYYIASALKQFPII